MTCATRLSWRVGQRGGFCGGQPKLVCRMYFRMYLHEFLSWECLNDDRVLGMGSGFPGIAAQYACVTARVRLSLRVKRGGRRCRVCGL